MAKDMEKKNIRSDKVRNIMMEKPPLLIRYGTVIIAVILLAAIIIDFVAVCLYGSSIVL